MSNKPKLKKIKMPNKKESQKIIVAEDDYVKATINQIEFGITVIPSTEPTPIIPYNDLIEPYVEPASYKSGKELRRERRAEGRKKKKK